MSMREEYLKLISDDISEAGTSGQPVKSVKITEFAVGPKGGKLHSMPADVDVVAVVSEDISASQGVFEVYCRGRLWGPQTTTNTNSLFVESQEADYFSAKLASTHSKNPIRMSGDAFCISYANYAPFDVFDETSLWYTSQVGYCCLGYDERFVGMVMPKAGIDAKFVPNRRISDTFIPVGEQFNDIASIYRKMLRDLNYLGTSHYLLTEDVNRHIYMLGFDIRNNSAERYLYIADNCIESLYSILFEEFPKNINFHSLASGITNAKLSYLSQKNIDAISIDPTLDTQLQKIISDARQSECYRYLAKHRNQRIAHFGRKIVKTEKRDQDPTPYIFNNRMSIVGGQSWNEVKDIIYNDLLHCSKAVAYVEECLEAIASKCDIFSAQPVRYYKDTQSYARQSALWDLYDMLPKDKFDIPFLAKGQSPPS